MPEKAEERRVQYTTVKARPHHLHHPGRHPDDQGGNRQGKVSPAAPKRLEGVRRLRRAGGGAGPQRFDHSPGRGLGADREKTPRLPPAGQISSVSNG